MRRIWVLTTCVVTAVLLAATPAAAGTLTWTRVGEIGVNFGVPGLARTANGILHVTWVTESAADDSKTDLLNARVSPDGTPGPSEVLQGGWSYIDPWSDLVVTPQGSLRAFWSGINPPNDGTSTATASAAGTPWTIQPGDVADQLGGPAATFALDGTSFQVSETAEVHRGLDPATPNHDYHAALGGCCSYGANIATDLVSGEIFILWYSNATGNDGFYIREVDPSTGAPASAPTVVAGSRTTYQGTEHTIYPIARLPLEARPGGGIYTAFGGGYPSVDKILLWQIGDASPTTIATGDFNDDVGLAIAPDGRVWVLYVPETATGRPKVFGRVSNPDVTEWSPPISLTVPASLGDFVSLSQVDANAGSDFVDVFVNLSDGTAPTQSLWHARFPSAPEWTDGNDNLSGSNSTDFIFGGAGNDQLSGRGGADQLLGGDGADTLDGGKGKDLLNGGPGKDKCFVTKGDKTKGCEVVRARRNI